ncbi:MAG: hypothetical protein AAGG51_02560 [Cyanobacteria bacterium P01_G01_bin.54]
MCFGVAFLTGCYFLWVGLYKPRFFWCSSQVLSMRRRWGDTPAQAFYAGLGGLLLAILCWMVGPAIMLGQTLHIALFAGLVYAGIKIYRWSNQPRPRPSQSEYSQSEQTLAWQRRKLAQLIKR